MTVEDHLPLARHLHKQYRGRWAVEDDDLLSAAYWGLLRAWRDWDAGRGVRFSTYAHHAIVGAMRDEAAQQGFVPRGYRRGHRELPAALCEPLSLERLREDHDEQPWEPAAARFEEAALERIALDAALADLDEREQSAFLLKEDGWTLPEIARGIERTVTGVWAIRSRALRKLRERLAEEEAR